MEIHVALSDLWDLPIDAIVNPANSLGLMDEGVGLEIARRGGRAIEDEVRSLAPIAVGAAVVTAGGGLYAGAVIHAPTIEEKGQKPTVESVRRATRAALIAAAAKGFATIGLPPMGGTAGAVPDDEAARAMVDELRAHRHSLPTTIYLVARDPGMINAYEEALRNATTPG